MKIEPSECQIWENGFICRHFYRRLHVVREWNKETKNGHK